MRILVTGGCGFIGSALVRRLVPDGVEVLNIDCLTYAGRPENVEDVAAAANYRFLQADICDMPAMVAAFAAFRPDAVMHLAAESHVDRSIDGPSAFIRTNVTGTGVLLEAALGYWRPFQFPEKLIPLMILNALDGRPLPVYGKGDNVRDWIHVDDHVTALLAVLAHGRTGETYLVGARGEQQNLDVVRHLCARLDALVPDSPHVPHIGLVTRVRDRPGHDQRYAIDPSRIEREIGWKPQMTFDAGLEDTIRWYMDRRDWLARVHDRGRLGGQS